MAGFAEVAGWWVVAACYYRENDRVMQAGEVLVMDMGALYQGYAGDVRRTIPVSGKYSADQGGDLHEGGT